MYDEDLPVMRKAIESKIVPAAKRAVLPNLREKYHNLEQLVPREASFSTLLGIVTVSVIPPCYTVTDMDKDNKDVLPLIDRLCRSTPWRRE